MDIRIDIPVDDYFEHQLDVMRKTFRMSKNADYDSIRKMIRALRLMKYLTSIHAMPTKDIDPETLFMKASLMVLPSTRMVESLMLLDNSILLALSGRYSSAHALLRPSYESLIVGGFYHTISIDKTKMIPEVRDFNGWKYPISFGDIVEEILESITPEEEHVQSFVLENRIGKFLQEHQPRLLPPNFSRMLRQVGEFYRLITPKYRKSCYELYGSLSEYVHTTQNVSYNIKDWKQGLVFSTTRLQHFSSTFLTVLDVLGYLFNVIMAGSYTFSGVSSHTMEVIEKFKEESESLPLTNLIVRWLCENTQIQDI